jgi:Uri superfamily endonuclease
VVKKIPANSGTYILLFRLPALTDIQIGKKQCLAFKPGLYAYAGSARGPGGLAARLKRHAVKNKRKHWHIDYLLPYAQITGALVVESRRRLECNWADWINQNGGACIPGFGATDCRCRGHLFRVPDSSAKILIPTVKKELAEHYFHFQ